MFCKCNGKRKNYPLADWRIIELKQKEYPAEQLKAKFEPEKPGNGGIEFYDPNPVTEPTNLEDKQDEAKQQVRAWMRSYGKNRWENQPYYPEILIEKKALEGVFAKPCAKWGIAVGACKGYPSLTFLYELSERMRDAISNGKQPIILYFGDYDPSGEDIPRSIGENLEKFGVYGVEIRRIALMEQQVIEWGLPPAPAKETDSRTANWDGLGQVELDGCKPYPLDIQVA